MAQITVDVGVKLNVMQSSLAELQKVLSHLEPDSAGFKSLSKIINEMTREMEKFQVQTSKGFTSGKQFDQAERSIEKMEETLAKAQIAMGNLKFSDIKLDANQTKAFSDLEQAIVVAEQRLDSIKEKTKQGIFADNAAVLTLGQLDKNGIRKSFDEIEAIVANGTKRVEGDLINAKAKFDELNKTVTQQTSASGKADNLLKNGITQQDWGTLIDKTGTRFKSGGKQEFLRILKEEFEVSDADIAQLQKLSLGKISEAFKKNEFPDIFKNLKESLTKNSDSLTKAESEVAKYENLQKAVEDLYTKMNAAKADGTPLGQGMADYNAEIERVAQALAVLRGEAVQNVSANSAFTGSISAMQGQLQGFANQLDQASAAFMRLQQQQQTFNSIKMAITNFMGFNQVLNITKTAIRDAMNHIKELDSVMNGIAIVTDMTTADLWKQVDAYSAMAQNYGVTIKGAYEVSRIYYQQGLETNDVLNLTNETLKLSKISGLDYATTTDYMTTAIRGFKMEMSEASTVVDVYSNLAANTAVSQQELAEAMTRTASSMESVGSTFEETSAMIATMVAVTRESANNIGSAMKSIASRYGELTKDPAKLMDADGEAMAFNKVDAALQSIGISMKDTEGQFRDFTDVILELSDVWDQLSSVQQRYVATQFAGNRQQSRFLALVSNGDLLRENLEVANDSEDVGTLQALKALDSIESKLNQVQVAYQQFYTTLGAEDLWKGFLDGATNFINTLNGLPKLFGKIPIGAATVIADAISLIKTVALNGLSAIATQFKSHLDGHVESLDLRGKGQKAGNDFNEGLRQGLSTSSSFSEINREIEATKQRLTNLSDISKTIVFKRDSNGDIINPQVISNAITRLQDLKAITDEEAKSLRELANEGPEKALEKIKELAIANKEYADSLNQIKNQKIYDSLLDFSSALNIVANAMDKSTDSSRIFAGSLMFVSGAIKGIFSVMKAMETGGPFPWVTVAMAAITAINGIATAIETPQEKLERLNKEAEDLSNTAKQVKADEKTLQSGIEKVNELKETRYESEEAAKEYQTAVDELAKSFPELISGFDSAGNVIIDTANAEEMLAAARQKTLQATYDAAVAEQKAKQQEIYNKAAEIKGLNNKSAEVNERILNQEPLQNSNRLGDQAFNLLRQTGGIYENDWIGEIINGILSGEDTEDYLKQIIDSSNIKNISSDEVVDLQSFNQAIEHAINTYNEFGEAIPNQLLALQEFSALLSSSDLNLDQNFNTSQFIIKDFINHLDNYDFSTQEGQKALNEFLEAYNSLDEETKTIIDDIFDISELNKLNTQLNGLSGENAGLRNSIISSYLLLEKSLDENWKFLNDNTQGALLLTKQLSSIWGNDKNKNKTWEDFKKTPDFQEALDAYYQGYNNLNKEQKEILEKIGNDTDSFTAAAVKHELGIDDGSNKAMEDAIDGFYESDEKLQERLNKILDQYKKFEEVEETVDGGKQLILKESENTPIVALKGYLEKLGASFSNNALDFIAAQAQQINELDNLGLTTEAYELSENIADIFYNLYGPNSQLDIFQRDAIIDILNAGNLSTIEGIEGTIEALESSGINTNLLKPFIDFLQYKKENIVENVVLSIQSELDSLLEKAEDDTKILSKATSGMSMKEANELVNKAKEWNVDLDIGSDIISNGDKLILSEQAFNDIQQGYGASLKVAAEKAQENLDKAKKVGLLGDNNEVIIPGTITPEMLKFLSKNGFNYDATTKEYTDSEGTVLINEFGQLQEAGQKAIELLFENIFDGLEDYDMAVDQIQAMIFQQQNWNKGDYSSLLNGQFIKKSVNQKSKKQAQITGIPALEEESFDIEAFNKYLSGKTQYNATDQPELKTAVEKARSGVDGFLSDLLSKGIDNFNVTDYANTGIESSTFNEMSTAIENWQGSYEDFIRSYVDLTGKTANEIDSLIAQAHAKDYENNVYDALSEVVGSFDKFSYEAGQQLARSLGTTVEDLISKDVFSVDETTGELSATYQQMKAYLITNMYNMSNKQYNELRAQLEAANAKQTDTNIFNDIISNRDKLNEENLASLATVLDMTYTKVLKILTQNADGSYKLDLSTIESIIQSGLITVNEETKQLIANEIDSIISSLTGLGQLQGKGTTSVEDMRKRAAGINEQLGTGFDISALFEYDETVHGFVYNTTGLIASVQSLSQQLDSLSGDERWAAEQLINDTKRQFAEAIDFDAILSSTRGSEDSIKAQQSFVKAVDNYNAILLALANEGEKVETLSSQALLDAIGMGGSAAVQAAQTIASLQGKSLSAQQVEDLYRREISELVNAIDTVIAKPGEIIDATTASIIGLNNVEALGAAGQYVVKSAADLYEAYTKLLERMEATGEATLADLNKVAALALENRDGEQAAIDALGDAAGMTFTRFGEILADAGIQLTEQMINDLETTGIIDLMGGNKMRIVDFSSFADLMGWDANSEEYVSAFKTYNDSLIDMNRKAERNILEEVNALGDAKGGDWLNLTQLSNTLSSIWTGISEDGLDYTQLDNLTAALEGFKGHLQDGILKLDSDANIPGIITTIASYAQQYGGLLQSDMAQLADTLDEVLKSYAEAISNGITGTFSNTEALDLKNIASNLGVDLDLDLDFYKTAEGLELSRAKAIELYQALQQVDSLKADLVFDDLYKSLTEDLGSGFNNMADTMATIKETQDQIAKNQNAINSLMEHDSANNAKIQALNRENAELEKQLDLYNEIASRQMTDPNSYNFMSGKLPDFMQGPANYWDSVGKAYKTMNEAASAGTIDLTDYYNIVNEMANLAALSGNLEIDGKQFETSAEYAAYAIEAGCNALTNVDGKGVQVDLSQLGINFVTGADSMQDNFQSGIKAMADSQIQMLDAAIQMLEVIVAMEKIGDLDIDDSGIIDLGEIGKTFVSEEDGQEYFDQFNKQTHDATNSIIEAAKENDDLRQGLEQWHIGENSVLEILTAINNDDTQWLQEHDLTAEKIQAILNYFKTLSEGDYDISNLQNAQQMFDQIAKLGGSIGNALGSTYDIGDVTVGLTAQGRYEIDWTKPNTTEAAALLNEDAEQAKEDLKVAFEHFTTGSNTSSLELTAVLTATGKIEIEKDDNGNVTKIIDKNTGRTFETKEAIAQFLSEEQLKSAGVDPNGITTVQSLNSGIITSTGSITLGETQIDVSSENGEAVKYTWRGQTYNSIDEITQAAIADFDKNNPDEINLPDHQKLVRQKLALKTEIQFSGDTNTYTNEAAQEFMEKAGNLTSATMEEVAAHPEAYGFDEEYEIITEPNGDITIKGDNFQVTSDPSSTLGEIAHEQERLYAADPSLVNSVAEGIKQAFEGDNAAQITTAIADGIKNALSGNQTVEATDATPPEVSLPEVTIKPNKITFDTTGLAAAAKEQGSIAAPTEVPINSIKVKPDIIDLDASGAQQPTGEGAAIPEIGLDNAKATVGTLEITSVTSSKLAEGTEITLNDSVDAKGNADSLELTLNDLQATLAEGNTVKIEGAVNGKGEIGTLSVTMDDGQQGELESSGTIDVGNVGDTKGNSGQLTVEATEAQLDEKDPNVGDVGEVSGTASNAKVTAKKYTVTFTGQNGTTNTIMVSGYANLIATLASYGVGFDETGNLINTGNYNVDIIPTETNIDLTTTANMDGADANVTAYENSRVLNLKATLEIEGKTPESLIVDEEGVSDLSNNADVAAADLEAYTSQILTYVETTKTIPKVDFDNLLKMGQAQTDLTTLMNELKQIGPEGQAIGLEIINGLAGADHSSSDAAANTVGDSYLNSLRTALGVDSPSIYAQEAGQFVVAGLVQGLNNTDGVSAAAETLGQTVVEAVKNATTNIDIDSVSAGISSLTVSEIDNATYDKTLEISEIAEGKANVNNIKISATNLSPDGGLTSLQNMSFGTTNTSLTTIQSSVQAIGKQSFSNISGLSSSLETAAQKATETAAAIANIADKQVNINTSANVTENKQTNETKNVTENKTTTETKTVNTISNSEINVDTSAAQAAVKAFGTAASSAGAFANSSATKVRTLGTAINTIPNKSSAVSSLATAMNSIPNNAHSKISSLANAIRNIPTGTKTMSLKFNYSTSKSGAAKGNMPGVAQVKGNAMATGNKTLMGELGPELVVSNGRYFVVGQNGAEFVNLAKDAIVFNHKQTKRLLKQGMIGSRGEPFTNENNAISFAKGKFDKMGRALVGEIAPAAPQIIEKEKIIEEKISSVSVSPSSETMKLYSFAKGNLSGNAMASASAALAALKELRAMWKSLLDADAKSLGSQAGRGGGGGGKGGGGKKPKKGGGGGGGDTEEEGITIEKTVVEEIERWYNLLRQIEKAEQDINYQEALRNKYETDRIANGQLIYKTYQQELTLLQKEINAQNDLVRLQKSWYDAKREELAKSSYGKIFTYDEYGLQQYVSDAPGSGRGLDILENLTRRDESTGKYGENSATVKDQLNYLVKNGFKLNEFTFNDDGTRVLTGFTGTINKIEDLTDAKIKSALKKEGKTDIKNKDIKDKREEILEQMMDNFWSKVDGWRDELDSLYDSYQESLEKIEENQAKQNEILQKLVDNELSIEKDIIKAIEAREQAQIDALKEQKEVLQDNNEKFLKGLSDQLSKEKEMYDKNQKANDLTKLQRQLDILRRSGGSASQIKTLQDQIDSQLKDSYFNQQQEQIDAMQEASDKQIERLDTQIALMEKNLEYQKEHGMLWAEVRDVMAHDVQYAINKILNWNPEYQEQSSLDLQETLRDFEERYQIWDADRGLEASLRDYLNKIGAYDPDVSIDSGDVGALSTVYRKAYLDNLNKENTAEAAAQATDSFVDIINGDVETDIHSKKGQERVNKDVNNILNTSTNKRVLNKEENNENGPAVTQASAKEIYENAYQDTYQEKYKERVLKSLEKQGTDFASANGEQLMAAKEAADSQINTIKEEAAKSAKQAVKDKMNRTLAAQWFAEKEEDLKKGTKVGNEKKDTKLVDSMGEDAYGVLRDGAKESYIQEFAKQINAGKSEDEAHIAATQAFRNSMPANLSTIKLRSKKKLTGFFDKNKDVAIYGITNQGKNVKVKKGKKTKSVSISAYFKSGPTNEQKSRLPRYKTGGIVDYTGPAWVDGSTKKPEAFLNAAQTEFLRNDLLGNSKTSLMSIVSALQDTLSNTSSTSSIDNSNAITIENISLNFETGTISNDYSARRAGDMAMQEILKIARKTGANTVSRR